MVPSGFFWVLLPSGNFSTMMPLGMTCLTNPSASYHANLNVHRQIRIHNKTVVIDLFDAAAVRVGLFFFAVSPTL